MQAPMSPKFRKHLSNPKNASKLTEKIILSSKSNDSISINIENRDITIHQIGLPKK
jgi:hypothetical protein